MSEAAVRVRQAIDLDEFERRLRAGEIGSKGAHDPVAELARLVGHADPFRMPSVTHLRRAAEAPDVGVHGYADTPAMPLHHRAEVYSDQLYDHQPELEYDASALGLHSTLHDAALHDTALHDTALHDAASHDAVSHHGGASRDDTLQGDVLHHHAGSLDAAHGFVSHAGSGALAEQGIVPTDAHGAHETPRRSWRGVIILSAILATGFAGLAAALTMKGSLLTASKSQTLMAGQIPVIQAPGPTKVQPPKTETDTTDNQASILDKTSPVKTAAAKVVNNVEQPVDLALQKPAAVPVPQEAAAPARRPLVASLEPNDAAMAVASARAASSVDRNELAAADAAPAALAPGQASPEATFPATRRVKIISVRRDGSVIGGDREASLGSEAPLPKPVAAVPNADGAEAAAPNSGASAISEKPAPAPNDAVGKLIDQSPVTSAAHPVAKAESTTASDTRASRSRRAKAKGTEVADLGGETGRTSSREGGFAAQLAASPTEAAAKSALRKLQKKYGTSLSGHKLSYHRVKVDGNTVYRVRIGSLSKDDANSICGKLQADGGSCFVNKN